MLMPNLRLYPGTAMEPLEISPGRSRVFVSDVTFTAYIIHTYRYKRGCLPGQSSSFHVQQFATVSVL